MLKNLVLKIQKYYVKNLVLKSFKNYVRNIKKSVLNILVKKK